MHFIEAVRLHGGSTHAHIVEVQWRDEALGTSVRTRVDDMVRWIRAGAIVRCGRGGPPVAVVDDGGGPQLRGPADELLALPRY